MLVRARPQGRAPDRVQAQLRGGQGLRIHERTVAGEERQHRVALGEEQRAHVVPLDLVDVDVRVPHGRAQGPHVPAPGLRGHAEGHGLADPLRAAAAAEDGEGQVVCVGGGGQQEDVVMGGHARPAEAVQCRRGEGPGLGWRGEGGSGGWRARGQQGKAGQGKGWAGFQLRTGGGGSETALWLDPPPRRDASEGKGPQRRPRRLGRRLEGVAKAVGGGYCRLQMPLRLAPAVRETVAGRRLGALEGGGGGLAVEGGGVPPV